jgi:hypothetical protein
MSLALAMFAQILFNAEHWKQVRRDIQAEQSYHFVAHVRCFIKSSLISYNLISIIRILFRTLNLWTNF